jgi:ribosomal protein S11
MLDTKKKVTIFEFYFGPTADRRIAALHINQKRHNLFFTATDLAGSVIGSITAKPFAANRKKRTAPHIIEQLVRRLVGVLRAYRVKELRLFVKLPEKRSIYAVKRALKGSGLSIPCILDFVTLAHNGCRTKKAKRL